MGTIINSNRDILLKKVTITNYRQDPYYAPVVKAAGNLLQEKGYIAPVDLFIRMGLLFPKSAEDWRRGRIPYLERVIRCNLSKASRILRILRMHAHDLSPQTISDRLQAMDERFSAFLAFFKNG